MDNSRYNRFTKSMTSNPSSYRSVDTDEIELIGNAGHEQTTPLKSDNHGRWSILPHLLPIIVILGLVALLVTISLPGFVFVNSGGVCKPDGAFLLSFDSYTPWKRDGIFAINLSFGSYSFGIAKFIDITWDVVVGRGGQALLAFFSYKVFTKALARSMESASVSTNTFEAITLRNDTMYGVSKLMRDFLRNRGSRARGAMACIILTALFVLALPTWLSAMTGYTADIMAFVQDSSGNLIPAEQFLPCVYTIHDGDRLGESFTKDYRVVTPWSTYSGMNLWSDSFGCPNPRSYNSSSGLYEWNEPDDRDCAIFWRTSQYAFNYGFLGQNSTESQFFLPGGTNVTIPEPSLNISASIVVNEKSMAYRYGYYNRTNIYGWSGVPYGFSWFSNKTHDYPYSKSNAIFYYAGSQTVYSLAEFNERGSCQQLNHVKYKWGFSFLLLYAFIVTWLVWTVAIYGLYLDSYYHSRLDVAGRHIGLKRAVLDLSLAMQKNLEAESTSSRLHSENQLSSLLRGTQITYQDLVVDSLPRPRLETSKSARWCWSEKWWLAALVVFTMFFIMSWTVSPFNRGWSPWFSALPGFGIFIVLWPTRKQRRRWLHFAFWFTLFWIGNIWWIVDST